MGVLGIALGVLVIVLGAAFALHSRRTPLIRRTPDQNVLLITIDTLRADALGCYGGAAATPNLDALARDGMRFDFAHAHAPLTLPSHTSLLTGLYPFQHGVRDNGGYRRARQTRTLAGMLKAGGFATGAFVGAFPVSAQFGLDNGFDVYDERFGDNPGPADIAIAERPAAAVAAVASAWIAHQPSRWFAWVHVYDPHAPYRPPAPFDRQYASNPYAGEVAYTDSALGSLLTAVREHATRPTLVVVTGDHGEALGDHGEQTHGLFAYEATLRIPLIVAQLDRSTAARPGRSSSDAVRHIDVLPTVLDALGMPVPRELPGRSLVPALNGARATGPTVSYFEAVAASLNRGWAPLRGVLVDREKYIDLPIPELYDLSADPHEQTNLADRRTDRRRALIRRLDAFGAPLPGARQAEDAETVARLKTLGYVSGGAPVKPRYTEADDPKRLIDLDQALHHAIQLIVDNRPIDAMPIYRQILSRRSDMAMAYVHLSFLQWKTGDVNGAIGTLRSALRANVRSTPIETQLGIYLAESGQAGEAIPVLERAAAADQPDVDALNALGIAYARLGDADRALALFSKVLGIDRSNHMAQENIGSVFLQREDFAGARQAFERALELDPESAAAHTGLGVAALKSGHRAEAIAQWQRAVELDPTDFNALYNVAVELVKDGRREEARPYLERFVRTAPPALYAADIRELRGLLARSQ